MRASDETVTRAKGLAILLVVLGHLVPRAAPPGAAWTISAYETARALIYLFHMPLFMFLSGYVAESNRSVARADLAARARRLLLPFLLFGLAIAAGKLLAAHLAPVDHPPADFAAALARLFVWTDESPALSVWYLAVLFIFWALTRTLLRASGDRPWPLAAAAAVLFLSPLPAIAYGDRVSAFYVFFVAGLVAGRSRARWREWVARTGIGAMIVFAAALVLCAASLDRLTAGGWRPTDRPYAYALLVVGLLSVPAVLHAAGRSRSAVLLRLGEASLTIYLLNTICIGVAKSALMLALPWDAAHFPLFLAVLLPAGLGGPLAIRAVGARRPLAAHDPGGIRNRVSAA